MGQLNLRLASICARASPNGGYCCVPGCAGFVKSDGMVEARGTCCGRDAYVCLGREEKGRDEGVERDEGVR